MAEAEDGDGDGWGSWMTVPQAAKTTMTSRDVLYRAIREGRPWIEARAPTDDDDVHGGTQRVVRIHQAMREDAARQGLLDFAACLEAGRLYEIGEVIDLVDCSAPTVYGAARSGRLESTDERPSRYGLRVPQVWRSVTSLAELLDIPRSTLERRLFGGKVEWAHYQVREVDVHGPQRWECRVHPSYTPAALTRADVARLLD